MSKTSGSDEVFEFLDSLPAKTDSGDGSASATKDDDILEFLDELEKSNKSKKSAKVAAAAPAAASPAPKPTPTPAAAPAPAVVEKEPATIEKQTDNDAREETPLNDPITSISNWWSSSGSSTVSNLWSKTTEQASQLQKKLVDEQKKLLDDQNIQLSASQLKGLTSNISKITDNLDPSKFADLANKLQEIVIGETEEVLRIHLVHDLANYPLLQYHVEQKFHAILNSQVQDGIRIFVDEWANPQEAKNDVDEASTDAKKLQLSIFQGKVIDGEKLAFANLDNAIKLFNKSREEIAKQHESAAAADTHSGGSEDKDMVSDIFISIVAVSPPGDNDGDTIKTTDSFSPGNFSFTVILKDITNNVTTITRSQGFPNKWAKWLEGTADQGPAAAAVAAAQEKQRAQESDTDAPASETEETEVDPGQWVKGWVEDGLGLAFATAAQNYIIERMGF